MEALFIQDGKSIDITAGSSGVAAGEVVVEGGPTGVAKTASPAGEAGAISVEGVYDIAKAAAAVFTVGAAVWFDTSSRCAMASSASSDCVEIGVAVKAAVSGGAVVRTLLG